MKTKICLLMLVFTSIAINANAQLKVTTAGEVGIGTTSPQSKLDVIGSIYAIPSAYTSGAYTNFVSGIQNNNYSSSSNCNRELRIQTVNNGSSYYQYLLYNGMITGNLDNPTYYQGAYGRFSGIEFQQTKTNFLVNTGTAGTGTPMTITPTNALTINYNGGVAVGSDYTGVYEFYVNGDVSCVSLYQSSDERFKKNINPIDSALNKILRLNGKTYEFRKDEFKEFNFDEGRKIGFIAQEVKEVLPEAVRLDSIYYSINYSEIIPVLVEAIKEQQTQIETLQKDLSSCCTTNESVLRTTNNNSDNNDGIAVLYQNTPNPFSKETQISCFIPNKIMASEIYIYDMHGTQLMKKQITGKGNVNITIQGSELKAGMYMYTLIVDGKEIDTKRMILTN